MRRIKAEKELRWSREVEVALTLKELAVIYAHLGETSASEDGRKVDEEFGKGTYGSIHEGIDIGLRTYEDIKEILEEEGVLE